MDRWLKRSAVLGLSAAVAMAAVMPPAVGHSHADGDRPHDHRIAGAGHSHPRAATAKHHHRHEDGREHSHAPEEQGGTVEAPTVPHRHAWFLFVDWTVPARGSHDPAPFGPEWSEVIQLARLWEPGAVLAGAGADVSRLAQPSALAGRIPDPAIEEARHRGDWARESIPLCDAARHACAGVLLI
ncbi:MAG: hypothetical protein WD069_14710 [Planctomycetales bacterium]